MQSSMTVAVTEYAVAVVLHTSGTTVGSVLKETEPVLQPPVAVMACRSRIHWLKAAVTAA